eukprot:Gb_15579 [translate_table: standard]
MDMGEQCAIRYKRSKLSKNVVSERRRRQKMNKLLYTLRALVPKISKMDKASILADAIDYVDELKNQVETAQSDVQSTNSSRSSVETRVECETDSLTIRLDASTRYSSGRKYLVQIDVRVVEASLVELRIQCKKESGILFNLTRALEALPLRLKTAALNTLDDYLILNIILQGEESCSTSEVAVKKAIEDCFSKQGLTLTGNVIQHCPVHEFK